MKKTVLLFLLLLGFVHAKSQLTIGFGNVPTWNFDSIPTFHISDFETQSRVARGSISYDENYKGFLFGPVFGLNFQNQKRSFSMEWGFYFGSKTTQANLNIGFSQFIKSEEARFNFGPQIKLGYTRKRIYSKIEMFDHFLSKELLFENDLKIADGDRIKTNFNGASAKAGIMFQYGVSTDAYLQISILVNYTQYLSIAGLRSNGEHLGVPGDKKFLEPSLQKNQPFEFGKLDKINSLGPELSVVLFFNKD